MYIPIKVLQSRQCLQSEELSSHQNMAKVIHKNSNKKPKPKPIKDSEENKKQAIYYQNQLQKDIYQWLFGLDLNTRIKICSISNKWYINILHQLSLLYFYQTNSHFQMKDIDDSINEKNEEKEAPDLNYYSVFFKVYETTFVPMSQSRNELKTIDNEFYNQIIYTSLNDNNDTVSLKKTFLANQEQFKHYFSKLSSNSFSLWIEGEYIKESNLYNFNKPLWIKEYQSLSLSKLFLSLFEQVIQINYQYYFHIKELYEHPHYAKFNEVFDTNEAIKQYLMKNDFKKILDDINVDALLKTIKSDSSIAAEINKQGDLNNKVMEINNKKNSHLADKILEANFIQHIILQLKDLERNDRLIDACTWFSFDSILQYANIVIRTIYNIIKNRYSDTIALDLIEEEQITMTTNAKTTGTGTTKKKKKKKKKKKSKDQLITIEDNKETEVLSSNNTNNQQQDDSNKKSKIIEEANAITSPKENNENVNLESNQLDKDNINNSSDDDDANQKKKKKKKKKKKEIHLYPITKKINQKNKNETKTISKNKQNNKEKESKEITTPQSKISSIESSSIKQTTDESISLYQGNKQFNQQIFSFNQQYPIVLSNNYYYYNYNYNSNNNPMHSYSSTDLLYAMLSDDILSFSFLVERNLSLLREVKENRREQLNDLIHSALSSKYDFELVYFGSYVTNLAIENSDIDIIIKYKSKSKEQKESNAIDKIINELIIAFKKDKDAFEYINPIYTANVPIIKLRCDLSSEVNDNTKKTLIDGYLFDIEELFKAKFDITFLETNDLDTKCPSQEIAEYVNNAIAQFPEIKPMMYVLKRFLQSGNLNTAYKGNESAFIFYTHD